MAGEYPDALSLSLFKRTSTLPDVAGEEVFTKSINY